MTIRVISTTTATATDAVVKVWKKLPFGKHPGLDATLPKEQAEHLLAVMSQPTTRRTPQAAQAAAQLLAEFRAGQHQNGHVEPAKAREVVPTVTPDKPTRQRTAKQATVQPITVETPTRRKTPAIFQAFVNITLLDVVYYITLLTACYGAWMGLGKSEMGISFGLVYLLVSLQALGMAKDPENRKTAVAGIVMVCLLEVIAFFIDLSMFNLRTWEVAKLDRLPFRSYQVEIPFIIAAVQAAFFSGIRIWCVGATFSLTHEQRKAAEKKKQEAELAAAHVATLRAALEDSARQWMTASGQNYFDVEKAGVLAERYFTVLKQTSP